VLDFGEATVGTAAALICRVPAGVCNVTLTNNGGTAVYIGSGTAETSSSGAGIPAGGIVSFYTYPSSTGSALYALGAGSPATISWVISTGS
jgi:hypothetical protein